MVWIGKNQEANAPIEAVWQLISDFANENKYWPPLSNVKILSRKENAVEREVTMKMGGGHMKDPKSLQTLLIDPREKSTTLSMQNGPIQGTRKIALHKLGEKKTRIEVNWEFETNGVPGLALTFMKRHLTHFTEKAAVQIAKEAESVRDTADRAR